MFGPLPAKSIAMKDEEVLIGHGTDVLWHANKLAQQRQLWQNLWDCEHAVLLFREQFKSCADKLKAVAFILAQGELPRKPMSF